MREEDEGEREQEEEEGRRRNRRRGSRGREGVWSSVRAGEVRHKV